MKILHKTENLLILRLRPVWVWILGGILAASGFSVIAIFAQVTTFTCTRIEPTNCKLVTSGLLASKPKEFSLNMLQGAKVEESSNDSHGSSTYRVIILTSNGKVPFTSYFDSDHSKKEIIVSHITNFVSNPKITSLTEKQDDRLWMYLIGGIVATGGLITLLARVVTCVFDKTLDILTIKQQGLSGTKFIEHRLSEIEDVLVEKSNTNDSSTYRVTIVLVSGDRLPFTSYYSSDRTSKQEMASCIKSFLNLNK
ncbi:hypothetical protein [uncultured Nostoc sp.]|uniref:hypothetical protein n=1 Tax=uncultured Nostoc sp. TaxID=340711 RepID=UPI00260F89C3|nr:hypothetical protein [uncultured Nostoc sp.]